jgi:hypothetical protein
VGTKYQCSKRLFGSQETPEEEEKMPKEAAAAADAKKMLSLNTFLDTTRKELATVGIPNCLQPKKRKKASEEGRQSQGGGQSQGAGPAP